MNANPVAAENRHQSLDVLRGIAILGILVMNIPFFFLPMQAQQYLPSDPLFTGASIDVWFYSHVFFEMKFITIFSALFGAGIILMVGEEADASRKVHFSRMRWLLLIGLIHAYVLWYGDILVSYAVFGMIAVYFRRMSIGKLLFWGLFWIAIAGLLFFAVFGSMALIPEEMSGTDIGIIPTPEAYQEVVAAYQAGGLERLGINAFGAAMGQVMGMGLFGGRIIGVMFLGMALFKMGFLTAQWSVARYGMVAVIGLAIGLPLSWWGGQHMIAAEFDFRAFWVPQTLNYVASLFTAIGYAAVVMIVCKLPFLAMVRYPFGAMGRMAFTNYLSHSLILVFLSIGGIGLGWFGEVSRVQMVQIVAAIWVGQLVVSTFWLQVFRFGPLEWLWRSLTYGKLQPFLK
ncbi:DUF418 domain-containing protein [Glycocaulis sp.]|uniref:DUF418 domain-containing protein n=1 Tax=Glycocaulis sp. TaxID=1969725 RepID=UPI0025BCBD7C|nr:DUF418 domain-containing protein [Glycocaulis sp.]MCH8522461.1 DUF418 domain-containing protein [Glycocaulis sp.]